jgi:hypothetical protein
MGVAHQIVKRATAHLCRRQMLRAAFHARLSDCRCHVSCTHTCTHAYRFMDITHTLTHTHVREGTQNTRSRKLQVPGQQIKYVHVNTHNTHTQAKAHSTYRHTHKTYTLQNQEHTHATFVPRDPYLGRVRRDDATTEALAHVVIGITFQLNGDALAQPCTQGLARVA